MENTEDRANSETTQKYIALISLINEMEKRLGWSELMYLILNSIIVMFIIHFESSLFKALPLSLTALELLFTLFSLVIGMAVCTYWTASSMRIQLKLKLRYFQARFLERKMNCVGEYIFSDESPFFLPHRGIVESPDNKETLRYPKSGVLRMDGFIGSAQPRQLSLLMPCLFFIVYLTIFIWVLIQLLS